MLDPRWKLEIIGEESMNVLVKTPDGNEVLMSRERMTNYVRVGNTLIPKSDVEWL